MNERLKELMISKGLHKYISEDCQSRMEMLAELVINECITVIYKQEKLPEGFIMPKSASILEHAIKTHFGVRESKREKIDKAMKEAFKDGVDLSGKETP